VPLIKCIRLHAQYRTSTTTKINLKEITIQERMLHKTTKHNSDSALALALAIALEFKISLKMENRE